MKDQFDKQTPDMITKRGRKPKYGRTMTPAERKAVERNLKQQQGFKLMWVSKEEQAVIEKMRSGS